MTDIAVNCDVSFVDDLVYRALAGFAAGCVAHLANHVPGVYSCVLASSFAGFAAA